MLNLFFYKFFQFSKAIGNARDDGPYAFKAMGILTVFVGLNAITLVAYFNCLVRHASNIFPSTYVMATIALVIYFCFYRYFLFEDRYVTVIQGIGEKQKLKGSWGTWTTIFYMVLTFAFITSTILLKC
jgi:hypothetical protein